MTNTKSLFQSLHYFSYALYGKGDGTSMIKGRERTVPKYVLNLSRT